MITSTNIDPAEIAKFSELAHRWWDPTSEFKPLHEINPLRLNWIDEHSHLLGKRVLDVGCGGGILSESMAMRGANVTGIDLSDKALSVARLHLYESGQQVEYLHVAAEDHAAQRSAQYDVVTCMEMLEHVPDPQSIVKACTSLVKPGGDVYFSTISRNLKAYLFAIIGAEYVLKLLPKGTHDYGKFINPAELIRAARNAGLDTLEIRGLAYNPLSQQYALSQDASVGYLIRTTRRV